MRREVFVAGFCGNRAPQVVEFAVTPAHCAARKPLYEKLHPQT
jgi:hypothetical protein